MREPEELELGRVASSGSAEAVPASPDDVAVDLASASARPDTSDEDAFSCPICLDILVRPVTFACGHRSCRACFVQLLESAPMRESVATTGLVSCPIGRCVLPPLVPEVDMVLCETVRSACGAGLEVMSADEEDRRAACLNAQASCSAEADIGWQQRLTSSMVLDQWRLRRRHRQRRVVMCFATSMSTLMAFLLVPWITFQVLGGRTRAWGPVKDVDGDSNGDGDEAFPNCTSPPPILWPLLPPRLPNAPPPLLPPDAPLEDRGQPAPPGIPFGWPPASPLPPGSPPALPGSPPAQPGSPPTAPTPPLSPPPEQMHRPPFVPILGVRCKHSLGRP